MQSPNLVFPSLQGESALGPGGSIFIHAKAGAISDGGNVEVMAGGTGGLASRGGSMTISAGSGSNDDEGDGGDGGTLV